ncbi:MAG TPA: translation initiation factor 2 [Anaeromyxobacteraceae bacterium]|jgi:hypothetical protein|nr:translation initiation factor 2 [Anaeromyxobacteraceae bacterium]
MKTLTELSGTLIRMAAAAVAEARKSLPKEEPAAEPAPAPVEAAPAEAAPVDAAPAPAEAAAEEATPAAETPPEEPKAEQPRKEEAPAESEAVKAALDEAVAKATGLSGDRLSRLRDALQVVGRRTADVRLVRVFAADDQVPGAKAVGGFQYLVDLSPASMTQSMTSPKKERGGRGGRGGGGGHGGGGGGGAGGGGAKGATTGGFSMDSLREDRRNERGSRPGGGRRPASGGRPGGGRPPAGGK